MVEWVCPDPPPPPFLAALMCMDWPCRGPLCVVCPPLLCGIVKWDKSMVLGFHLPMLMVVQMCAGWLRLAPALLTMAPGRCQGSFVVSCCVPCVLSFVLYGCRSHAVNNMPPAFFKASAGICSPNSHRVPLTCIQGSMDMHASMLLKTLNSPIHGASVTCFFFGFHFCTMSRLLFVFIFAWVAEGHCKWCILEVDGSGLGK